MKSNSLSFLSNHRTVNVLPALPDAIVKSTSMNAPASLVPTEASVTTCPTASNALVRKAILTLVVCPTWTNAIRTRVWMEPRVKMMSTNSSATVCRDTMALDVRRRLTRALINLVNMVVSVWTSWATIAAFVQPVIQVSLDYFWKDGESYDFQPSFVIMTCISIEASFLGWNGFWA